VPAGAAAVLVFNERIILLFAATAAQLGRPAKCIAASNLPRPRWTSKIPDAPNIAGNPEGYLVKSLNASRKGGRKNDMMSLAVQPLTDQDVADLAAYYAAIEVTVRVPK
jgi:hypothetical protein